MASLHAIKTCNNRLFRFFNRLFFWHIRKRLWNPIFLALRIKPQTRFSKNTFLVCQDSFKVRFTLWKFIHSSYKIVDFTLKSFTIFTSFWVTQVRRILEMQFKIFKISFWIFQSSSTVLTLFSSQLFNPFNRLFKRVNQLASSWVSLKAWSNWL